MNLGSKDLKIIEILKSNAREPIKSIAKKTGMRPSTVHQRVQKLIKQKIITGFTINLDSKAVGENFIAFILIKGNTSEYINNKFLNKKNVKEVFGITGEYDVLAKLKFKDVEEFNRFIINLRKELKGVQATMTMVATANIKEE